MLPDLQGLLDELGSSGHTAPALPRDRAVAESATRRLRVAAGAVLDVAELQRTRPIFRRTSSTPCRRPGRYGGWSPADLDLPDSFDHPAEKDCSYAWITSSVDRSGP